MKLDLKFGLRLIAPIVALILVIGRLSGPVAGHLVYKWSVKDINLRANLIASSLSEDLIDGLPTENSPKIARQFENLVKDERLYAIGFCSQNGKLTNASADFFKDFDCAPKKEEAADQEEEILSLPSGKRFFVNRIAVTSENSAIHAGSLIVIHDMAFVDRRVAETRQDIRNVIVIAVIVLALFILLVAEFTRRLWIHGVRKGIVGWNTGAQKRKNDFEPIIKDVKRLISELESERKVWSAESIRQLITEHLRENEIFIVSNREPYIHHKNAEGVLDLERPASGIVTALEPIVSVCKGTWIAHGSGTGDRESVDQDDCIMVPPENPSFKLKRIWLSPEEKQGYYNGFSNEAIWPLCLLTHTRPIFRTTDWDAYVKVNRRFADAVINGAKSPNPLVMVQDYHLALVPRMIREALPQANVISFWHIPWPNPEIFGICPWREELLDGLLGSQIIGFHTPAHVQNFLQSVQQNLESKVDLVNGQIHYKGNVSKIAAYPMSIEWQNLDTERIPPAAESRKRVLAENKLPSDIKIGVGIDRLDYTKGILERFQAVEKMIDLNPGLKDRFCFIQIASPSRTEINAYQNYAADIHREVERINKRFGGQFPLIILREFQHSREAVYKYYRSADLCFVSSLHDGMNLVAKEFVAAKEDGQGVLVLSKFTGAAGSFPDALLVNPYHIDACADALARALYMHPDEQKERMSAMRRHVREHNIFRWAGYLLLDSAEIQRVTNIDAGNVQHPGAVNLPEKRKGGV
jgi:trehalose-6-phosphate synthase